MGKTRLPAAKKLADILITHFQRIESGNAARAIETGITVTYARPFGENHSLGSLPRTFRDFSDPGDRKVHETLLSARNLQEAHNNLARRASLVNLRIPPDFVSEVETEISREGRTLWGIKQPRFSLENLQRVSKLLTFQETRIRRAIAVQFEDLLAEMPRQPGTYLLAEIMKVSVGPETA